MKVEHRIRGMRTYLGSRILQIYQRVFVIFQGSAKSWYSDKDLKGYHLKEWFRVLCDKNDNPTLARCILCSKDFINIQKVAVIRHATTKKHIRMMGSKRDNEAQVVDPIPTNQSKSLLTFRILKIFFVRICVLWLYFQRSCLCVHEEAIFLMRRG